MMTQARIELLRRRATAHYLVAPEYAGPVQALQDGLMDALDEIERLQKANRDLAGKVESLQVEMTARHQA